MNLSAILNADMRTVSGWLNAGWRWWLAEMAAMVPPALKRWLQPRAAVISYDPHSATLGFDDTDDRVLHRAFVVELPADLCLMRRIELPLLAESELAAMIALDAGRIMPLGDTMAIASRIAGRDAAAGRMQVDVAGLAPDAAQRLAMTMAIQPRLPNQVLAPVASGDPIDLMPALRRAGLLPGNAAASRWWLVAGFLFALNIGLVVWRDVAATDAMRTAIAAQQPAVDVAHRIEARIRHDDAAATATLAARAHAEPLALLARIAGALPPGAWLQRFAWQGDAIRLTGFRPLRADIAGAMRRAGFTVTRYGDSAAGQDKLGQPFELTMTIGKR